MINVKKIINKNKFIFITLFLVMLVGLLVSFPSLAKLKNRNTLHTVSSWDGTIAESYKSGDGTKENPYIISNGAEYAFFLKQLENINYEGKYFELSNDIIINPGIFEYSEIDGLKYIIDGTTYYVKEYTNEYYNNKDRQGEPVGFINKIPMAKDFKGDFNGNSFTIFGVYISNFEKENLAMFTNLEGNLKDLYITNSIVYGRGNVSGIALNTFGATLENILYDGNVINKSDSKNIQNEIESVMIDSGLEESIAFITLPELEINGYIKNIKLIGEYECNNVESINQVIINGIDIYDNVFEIDLSASGLLEIPVSVISSIDGTQISFFNLKYNIEYYDDITTGMINTSINTRLNNVINKASVFGNYISSGFIGKVQETLQISQSYNVGNIKGIDIASGIIGIISDNLSDVVITNVYNNGEITSDFSGSFIGVAKNNTGVINITNSINVIDNYSINTSINTSINVFDSYSINGLTICNGITNGEFKLTENYNLKDKVFLSKISYNEFLNFEDVKLKPNNAWIYDNYNLPILYIDNLNDPIASININKYSWSNLSSELNVINTTKNITFSIEELSQTKPISQKYYHITNNIIPLTAEQLDNLETWETYENIITIKEAGYYVIYAKIISSEGKTTYINTDVIELNTSGFKAEIMIDDYVSKENKLDLKDIYFNKEFTLNIIAQDDLFGISNIQYKISNVALSEEDLENLETWEVYDGGINIGTPGSYVIYAKVTNGEGAIKYVSTDYLLYNGYIETLNIGNLNNFYNTNYVTNNSSISLSFEGNFDIEYHSGYTHNLISNILLPVGTKLTLIDKLNNKVYSKMIDTEEDLYGYNSSCNGIDNCSKFATYSFDLFQAVGTKEKLNYDETLNYDKKLSNEKYVIIIDFSAANLIDNYYDLMFSLAIKNNEGKYLYQTLNNTIRNINVYSNINNEEIVTKHNITSNYENQTIYYNTNSKLDISFYNEVIHSTVNNKDIIDTTYENKKSGLLLKLYNEENIQLSKQYLDNMIFELDGKEFFANDDNSIKINLGSVLDFEKKTLTIKTKENSSGLINGTYYIKVNKFISDDGYYYDSLYEDEFVITVIVENQEIIIPSHSFDVEMQTESVMIDKKQDNHLVSFAVMYYGDLIDPNVKVSLHQKDELTAYNQKYTIIDIAYYSSDKLIKAETNKYYVDLLNTPFELNIQPNKFENNGYKYVFELYDGSNLVSKIEKYFIVK